MQDDDRNNSQLGVTDLTACTCATLRKATRVVTQAYDSALQPSGLKATQFTLLSTLEIHGSMPLTRLAAALVMDRTTLTRNLKPLVGKGFVRIEAAADQRIRQVVLTAAGRRGWEGARLHWQSAQSRLVEQLGEKRWAGLIGDLSAVIAAVQRC